MGTGTAYGKSRSHSVLLILLLSSLALHWYRSGTTVSDTNMSGISLEQRSDHEMQNQRRPMSTTNRLGERPSLKTKGKRKDLQPPVIAPEPNTPMLRIGKRLSLDLVGASFEDLNDEEKVMEATLNIAKNTGLISLGVSSFKLNPHGVNVVATTSDGSHITVQTWPEHGVAVFDFTTRQQKIHLQEILPMIANEYGGDLSESTYSVIRRGNFDDSEEGDEEEEKEETEKKVHSDLLPYEIMATHKYKKNISTEQSPYQHVAIWEHHDLMDDGYSKDTVRSLFLDGVMQSSEVDESKYHESLVHPAFIASAIPPKRVLIVGGGEGATLRECLKWASVEQVTMVDLDAQVVNSSREFLGGYTNCTGFGSANCFDDPRTNLYTEDFIAWFDKHIGNDICAHREEKQEQLYDVVIVDLLDTEELPEGQAWAEHLYSDLFYQRLSCAMNRFGVIITQFGEAPNNPFEFTLEEPPQSKDDIGYATMLNKKLNQIKTKSRHFKHNRLYESYINSFRGDWTFAVGIMSDPWLSESYDAASIDSDEDLLNKIREYGNAGVNDYDGTVARVNLKLRRGLKTGADLDFYDGAIQHQFRYPRGGWEGVYCMQEENQHICSLHNNMTTDFEEEWFEVKLNEAADGKSGVFAKKDIPKGTVSGLWDAATAFDLAVTDFHKLKTFANGTSPKYKELYDFLHFYGHDGGQGGTGDRFYTSGLSMHTFANHACDRKPTHRAIYNEFDWGIDLYQYWNPLGARIPSELDHITIATRDIKQGEMITDDYTNWDGIAQSSAEKVTYDHKFKEWCGEDYEQYVDDADDDDESSVGLDNKDTVE